MPPDDQKTTASIFPVPTTTTRHDPLIVALIGHLPRDGEPFPVEKRLAWLRAAAAIFQLTYGVVGEIKIEVHDAGI